ncbi:MAG TPA: hypothetical protein VLV83_12675 [Acidobacteriota bacterium]|nr:hypothetical protein [Acidobacteriota bacterium]
MELLLGLYLATVLQSPQPPPAELREAVEDYWEGLARGDKARALPHVHPQTLKAFLKRNEPALQEWTIEEYRKLDSHHYLVSTRFKRHLPGGVLAPSLAREDWIHTEEGWRVRIPSLEEQRQKVGQAIGRNASLPRRLQVLPERLRFYRGSDQPAVIAILNGLPQQAHIAEVEADPRWLEVKLPEDRTVPSGGVRRIALYRSASSRQAETAAKSPQEGLQVTLVVTLGQEVRRFVIPCQIDAEDPLLEWIRKQKPPPRPPPRPR